MLEIVIWAVNVKFFITLATALLISSTLAATVTKLEGTIPGYKRDPSLLVLGGRGSVLSSTQIGADGKFSLSLPAVDAKRLGSISTFFKSCAVKPTVTPADGTWLNIISLPVSDAKGVFAALSLDSVTKKAKAGDVWVSWVYSAKPVDLAGSSTCVGKRSKTSVSSAWTVKLEAGWNLLSRTVNTVDASGIKTTYAAVSSLPANATWKLAK